MGRSPKVGRLVPAILGAIFGPPPIRDDEGVRASYPNGSRLIIGLRLGRAGACLEATWREARSDDGPRAIRVAAQDNSTAEAG